MRPDVKGRIAERARTQLGLITFDELEALGVTRSARRHLLASGEWRRAGLRVLRSSSTPASELQEILAAALDLGGRTVATGRTAARLWRAPCPGSSSVHLLTRRGGNHRSRAAVVHETFWLPAGHTAVREGVPVVSAARLPFELAADEPEGRVELVVDHVMQAHGVTPGDLALTVAELCRRGRPGSSLMRRLVDDRLPGYVPPASALESAFRLLCRGSGIPEPDRQVEVGGDGAVGRVDVLWANARLVVELDSRRWHDAVLARESDRWRDAQLVRAGWRVVRITWRQIHDAPHEVVALLRDLLRRAA